MLCSWVRRVNIFKITKPTKAIYRFNAIPIEMPPAFFAELKQIIVKFVTQKTVNSQNNLEKEEQSRKYHAPWFQTAVQSCVCSCVLSRVWLFATLWTVDHQPPLSMGFFRQEYWSGLHFLLQGIFSTQGSNSPLQRWQADSLSLSHQESPEYKATVINTVWHWHKNKHIDQWNRRVEK